MPVEKSLMSCCFCFIPKYKDEKQSKEFHNYPPPSIHEDSDFNCSLSGHESDTLSKSCDRISFMDQTVQRFYSSVEDTDVGSLAHKNSIGIDSVVHKNSIESIAHKNSVSNVSTNFLLPSSRKCSDAVSECSYKTMMSVYSGNYPETYFSSSLQPQRRCNSFKIMKKTNYEDQDNLDGNSRNRSESFCGSTSLKTPKIDINNSRENIQSYISLKQSRDNPGSKSSDLRCHVRHLTKGSHLTVSNNENVHKEQRGGIQWQESVTSCQMEDTNRVRLFPISELPPAGRMRRVFTVHARRPKKKKASRISIHLTSLMREPLKIVNSVPLSEQSHG